MMIGRPFFSYVSLASGALALSLLWPGNGLAQTGSGNDGRTNSSQVKQPDGSEQLQRALQRLSLNSKDLYALIDAGSAALRLGDPVAALGVFARADEISSENGRVKAGLGSALLGNENPFEALAMFARADELGVPQDSIALDRGLAYDLVGKQVLAQNDYRFLLSRNGNNPEAIRRFALSLGISGKRKEAEALLTPLLYANDRAAWRVRAFILAINEDLDSALAITRGSLQPRVARAIEPFIRFMPKLTASQQAAAAHFGHFPQEANIGRDNPRNGEFASLDPSRTQKRILTSRADAGLIPTGEPLGAVAQERASAIAKPNRSPRRRPGQPQSQPVSAPIDQPVSPTRLEAANAKALAAQRSSSIEGPSAGPGFESLDANAVANNPVAGRAAVAPAREVKKPSFAALMTAIDVPAGEQVRDEDAVDITTITPAKARPKPKAEPKEPPKPKHPSRHWVQVAGGADSGALKFEWRRLVKKAPDAFENMQGWTTPLNKTNRVLTGPFDSKKKAQAFVNTLAKKDISAFTFTSAKGQEIKRHTSRIGTQAR